MAKRRRSPVYLHCERLFPDDPYDREKLCEWRCDESRLGTAMFVERGAPQFTAIIHPNTKPSRHEFPWQASMFRDDEPISDSLGKSCAVLLNRAVPHHGWRLRQVLSKPPRR